jgi:hypothetical protein
MTGHPDFAESAHLQLRLACGLQRPNLAKLFVEEIDFPWRNLYIKLSCADFQIPNMNQHGAPLLHTASQQKPGPKRNWGQM